MYAYVTVLQHKLFDCMKKDLGERNHKKEFMKNLDQLETNSQRVDFAHDKLSKYNLLDERYIADEKSDDKANEFRIKATNYFSPGKYLTAVEMCTKQIMHAKSNEMRASGYANRASALYRLELYQESMIDTDRAIIHNYDEQQRPKIIARKQQAADILRQAEPKEKAFEEPPKIPEDQKNPAFPSASNSVSVQTDDADKRYLVAKKDIQIGEVIIVEEPFAATIGDSSLYHCHECLCLCYNLIPCLDCTAVLYCSEVCRQKAYVTYHQHECPILLSLLRLFSRETCFLFPLKLVFHQSIGKMSDILKLAEEFKIEDTRKAMVELTLMGAVIADLIKKHTKMFEGPDGTEMETFFKNSIAPFIYYCMSHTITVTEYIDYGKMTEKGDPVVMNQCFAYALYYFNFVLGHNCCPNIYRHFHGVKQVYRACRTIKKGEKCISNFGPNYNLSDKNTRQLHISVSYGFTCKCRACEEDWPQLAYTTKSTAELKEMAEVLSANIKTIRKLISKKIEKVKQLEKFEPRGDLTHNSKMLEICYDILGNKRWVS